MGVKNKEFLMDLFTTFSDPKKCRYFDAVNDKGTDRADYTRATSRYQDPTKI